MMVSGSMTGRFTTNRPNLMESNPLETLIRRLLEQGASITVIEEGPDEVSVSRVDGS